MSRRSRVWLSGAGAILSALVAVYCLMGYGMLGSFAVAHDLPAEPARSAAVFWGVGFLIFSILSLLFVAKVYRQLSR